jgi:hypothetical protein
MRLFMSCLIRDFYGLRYPIIGVVAVTAGSRSWAFSEAAVKQQMCEGPFRSFESFGKRFGRKLGDVDYTEGRGALNVLEIDDIPIYREGEEIDEASIVSLPMTGDLPILPDVVRDIRSGCL